MNSAARLLGLILCWFSVLTLTIAPAWAAAVQWQEVPASPDGQQWWDRGSLRWTRDGHLRLLSRFQPSASEGSSAAGELYVMDIDCQQKLFRDISVNGLPKLRSQWQLSEGEPLIVAVIDQACRAAPPGP